MGESFDIQKIEMANGNTLVQVDFRGETTGGRMFIPLRDILKALNNEIQTDWERVEIEYYGMQKEDPNAPVFGLID